MPDEIDDFLKSYNSRKKPRSTSLSPDEIADTLRQAGWGEEHIPTMTAIAQAESSGNPSAHNPKYPDDSYGLWQINRLAHPQYSPESLRDPVSNAKAALDVFKRQGLRAWSTYSKGNYRKFLGGRTPKGPDEIDDFLDRYEGAADDEEPQQTVKPFSGIEELAAVSEEAKRLATPPPPPVPQRKVSRPAGATISVSDAAWHLGMNPDEARRLSPKAIEVVAEAVKGDVQKREAGQQIAPPPLRYQQEMRKKAGLKPLEFNIKTDEAAPSPYYQPSPGQLPRDKQRVEVRAPFRFGEGAAEETATREIRNRVTPTLDYSGEEYKNFLLQNRSLDSPQMRAGFADLKVKQQILPHGVYSAERDPFAAQEASNRMFAEQQRQQRISALSPAQKALEGVKRLGTGAASVYGETLKGFAAAGKAMDFYEFRGMDTKEHPLYKLGEAITQGSRDFLGVNSDADRELFAQAPEVIGQAAAFALGGWVARAPKLAVLVLGSGMTAGDTYDEVRKAGGTDDEAVRAALLSGGLLGPTELIGMRGAMKAIEGTVQEATLRSALKLAAREGRRDIIENALQEAGQELGQGLITGQLRTMDDIGRAALLGGIGGTATAPITIAAHGLNVLEQRRTISTPLTPDATGVEEAERRQVRRAFDQIAAQEAIQAADRDVVRNELDRVGIRKQFDEIQRGKVHNELYQPSQRREGLQEAINQPSVSSREGATTTTAEAPSSIKVGNRTYTYDNGLWFTGKRRVRKPELLTQLDAALQQQQSPSATTPAPDTVPAPAAAPAAVPPVSPLNLQRGAAAESTAPPSSVEQQPQSLMGQALTQALKDRGYLDRDIALMSPGEKQEIIKSEPPVHHSTLQNRRERNTQFGTKGQFKSGMKPSEVTEPVKPVEAQVVKPWEMSREQIEQEFQRKKSEDANLEATILGPELAKRYERLQRTANSSTVTAERADAASAEIEKIEASLSERDRNRLYGIGETGPQLEDLREYRRSLSNLDDTDPQSLAESMRWAVSRVGRETDPTKMTQEQQIAYGTLREAARIAHENGWDTQAISKEAVRAAGERFADPEDAAFILDRFIKKEPTAARPERKALPASTEPAPKPVEGVTPSQRATEYADVERRLGGEVGPRAKVFTPEERAELENIKKQLGTVVATERQQQQPQKGKRKGKLNIVSFMEGEGTDAENEDILKNLKRDRGFDSMFDPSKRHYEYTLPYKGDTLAIRFTVEEDGLAYINTVGWRPREGQLESGEWQPFEQTHKIGLRTVLALKQKLKELHPEIKRVVFFRTGSTGGRLRHRMLNVSFTLPLRIAEAIKRRGAKSDLQVAPFRLGTFIHEIVTNDEDLPEVVRYRDPRGRSRNPNASAYRAEGLADRDPAIVYSRYDPKVGVVYTNEIARELWQLATRGELVPSEQAVTLALQKAPGESRADILKRTNDSIDTIKQNMVSLLKLNGPANNLPPAWVKENIDHANQFTENIKKAARDSVDKTGVVGARIIYIQQYHTVKNISILNAHESIHLTDPTLQKYFAGDAVGLEEAKKIGAGFAELFKLVNKHNAWEGLGVPKGDVNFLAIETLAYALIGDVHPLHRTTVIEGLADIIVRLRTEFGDQSVEELAKHVTTTGRDIFEQAKATRSAAIRGETAGIVQGPRQGREGGSSEDAGATTEPDAQRTREGKISARNPNKLTTTSYTADDPFIKKAKAAITELDAVGAPDTEYKKILSTGSKTPLRKGETWRSRVVDMIRRAEGEPPVEKKIVKGRKVEVPPPKREAVSGIEGRDPQDLLDELTIGGWDTYISGKEDFDSWRDAMMNKFKYLHTRKGQYAEEVLPIVYHRLFMPVSSEIERPTESEPERVSTAEQKQMLKNAKAYAKAKAEEDILELPSFRPEGEHNLYRERRLPKRLEESGRRGGHDRLVRTIGDAEAVDVAFRRMENEDPEAIARNLMSKPEMGKYDFAQGIVLIDHFQQQGDIKMADDIASNLARKSSQTAEALQAHKLVQRLSPEGVLREANQDMQRAFNDPTRRIKPEDAEKLVRQTQRAKDLEEEALSLKEEEDSLSPETIEAAIRKVVEENDESLKDRLYQRADAIESAARERLAARKKQHPPRSGGALTPEDIAAGRARRSQQRAETRPARRGPRLGQGGGTPIFFDVADYAAIGAAKMVKGTINFTEWSQEMISEFGEDIRPFLSQIFRASGQNFLDQKRQAQYEKDVHRVTEGSPESFSADEIEELLRIDRQRRSKKAKDRAELKRRVEFGYTPEGVLPRRGPREKFPKPLPPKPTAFVRKVAELGQWVTDDVVVGALKQERAISRAQWEQEMAAERGVDVRDRKALASLFTKSFNLRTQALRALEVEAAQRKAGGNISIEEAAELIHARKTKTREAIKARNEMQKTYDQLTKTKLERGSEFVLDIINIPKAVKTSMDFSAPGRQGWILLSGAGVSGRNIQAKAFQTQFENFYSKYFNEDLYRKNVQEIVNHPRFSQATRNGLFIAEQGAEDVLSTFTNREEAFLSKVAHRIPFVLRSQRAYTGYLDRVRLGYYDMIASEFERKGKTEVTHPAEYKALAEVINTFTGRGSINSKYVGPKLLAVLNALTWSPRFLRSRVSVISPLWYGKMLLNPATRESGKFAARTMVKALGTNLSFLALAGMAGAAGILPGMKVNWDRPEDSDWLRLRYGNTEFDISGGSQSVARWIYKMGKNISDRVQGKKIDENPIDITMEFLSRKEAPAAQLVTDLWRGKDFQGRSMSEKSWLDHARTVLAPIISDDIREALREDGWAAATRVGLASAFGIGTTTFKETGIRAVAEPIRRELDRLNFTPQEIFGNKSGIREADTILQQEVEKQIAIKLPTLLNSEEYKNLTKARQALRLKAELESIRRSAMIALRDKDRAVFQRLIDKRRYTSRERDVIDELKLQGATP